MQLLTLLPFLEKTATADAEKLKEEILELATRKPTILQKRASSKWEQLRDRLATDNSLWNKLKK